MLYFLLNWLTVCFTFLAVSCKSQLFLAPICSISVINQWLAVKFRAAKLSKLAHDRPPLVMLLKETTTETCYLRLSVSHFIWVSLTYFFDLFQSLTSSRVKLVCNFDEICFCHYITNMSIIDMPNAMLMMLMKDRQFARQLLITVRVFIYMWWKAKSIATLQQHSGR